MEFWRSQTEETAAVETFKLPVAEEPKILMTSKANHDWPQEKEISYALGGASLPSVQRDTDNFEKMELNFLQVILSFQIEFKFKTPRQKIHWKLLLESMKTIRDNFKFLHQTKQTRQLKTLKLEKK